MFVLKKGCLCPVCEKGRLHVETKHLPFVYKNRATKILNQKVFVCDVCDYEGLSDAQNEIIEKSLADFRRRIDGLLPCDMLMSIRETLGLNKKSMAKLLSVNEKTVGRYESGQVTQGAQVDKLYRALRANPSLVRTIEPSIPFMDLKPHTIEITTDGYMPEPANGYYYDIDSQNYRKSANGA